jgi:hypothetical protein
MTSTKSTSESSSYNESPLLARSRASSLSTNNASRTSSYSSSPLLLQQQYNARLMLTAYLAEEEELGAPINIYNEPRGRLEEDKRARTELDTDILNNDLYCPVQQKEVNDNTASRGLFSSLLPRFSFSANNNFGGVMESTKTDNWGYYNNDMFNTTNSMFGGFDGINGINGGVACQ